MPEVFFSLFIWPIQALIQGIFIFFMKVFSGNPGLTIICLSFVVNTLVLPIYLVADRWQAEERNLLDRMKRKVADIRAVFRGDERQMILGTYYRQMGYRPLFSLRSTVGLLIQIPFFLAAYDFLSHSPYLKGVSFLFLADLSKPDGLLTFGNLSINLLPFVMTGINLLSAFLYTSGLRTKDKVQLFGLASVFLVLLYGSPSGLVLYWTISNLFSLGKNSIMAVDRPGRVFNIGLVVLVPAAIMVPASGLFGPISTKILTLGMALALFFAAGPWLWRQFLGWASRRPGLETVKGDYKIVLLASVCLTLLTGLVVPSLLIASSPNEFDQVWSMLGMTLLQSISLYFFIPMAIWALANPRLKRLLAPGIVVLVFFSLLNCFAFPSDTTLSSRFQLVAGDLNGKWVDTLTSCVSFTLAVAAGFLLWKFGKRPWVRGALTVVALALATTGAVNLITVNRGLNIKTKKENTAPQPVFHMSKTQKNLWVMFLDRAVSDALPRVMELAPELRGELAGFTYYPNTVSFAQNTISGSPALFGGYDYTPEAMNARKDELASSKINEALKVLPKIFGEAGYRVTFSDPAYANLRWEPPDLAPFDGMKNVTAVNIKGDNTNLLYNALGFGQADLPENQKFDYDILERFSLFRIGPPSLRFPLYRNGSWWNANKTDNSFGLIMNSYSNLYFLPKIVVYDSNQPTLNMTENETTHDTGAFGPDLKPTPWIVPIPPKDLEEFGDRDSAEIIYNLGGSMRALVTWFHQLKAEGIWDNTRIVIVADHGVRIHTNDIKDDSFARFNPLLMVKDFNSEGPFQVSQQFMTNADVPAIITKGVVPPVNPWNKKPFSEDGKKVPLHIHFAVSWPPADDSHTLLKDYQQWYLTEPSIYTKDGWKEVK